MPALVAWPKLGTVAPGALVDARLEAHHALQLIVSLGISFLPPREDDSHTNLEWLPQHCALATPVIPGRPGFRGALRLADLTLMLLDSQDRQFAQLPLSGGTVASAFEWLNQQVERSGAGAGKLTGQKHYTIPQHPVSKGAVFRVDTASFHELSSYYGGAALVLSRLASDSPNASSVRCWPHHFDLATLITLDANGKNETRTIAAGLSPGDGSYPEPYYYVTPHPYLRASLPGLARGAWHMSGWTGAVLTGSDVVALKTGDAERAGVEEFLDSAIAACRSLLAD